KTVGDNLEAAKAARAEIVSRLHRGERVAPTRITLGDFAEEWLAAVNRRPRTLEAHRYQLDRHVLPRFKRRRIADITADDVARMVAEMQRGGYSGSTIAGALGTLSACLGRAKRRGLIPANPVAELTRDERPKMDRGERRVLSEAEIATVLEKATEGF